MSMIFWIIMLIIILVPWSKLLRLRKKSEGDSSVQEQQNDQQ